MNSKNKKQAKGMVDISEKRMTKRIAVACATVRFSPKAFKALMDGGSPKGDVFETAKVAGVFAAKKTPQLIPMCHPLELNKINVSFAIKKKQRCVVVHAEVVCFGRTGVEMEALTAAATAALTIYDMMKWADKGTVISDVMLVRKSGGKSGDFVRSW